MLRGGPAGSFQEAEIPCWWESTELYRRCISHTLVSFNEGNETCMVTKKVSDRLTDVRILRGRQACNYCSCAYTDISNSVNKSAFSFLSNLHGRRCYEPKLGYRLVTDIIKVFRLCLRATTLRHSLLDTGEFFWLYSTSLDVCDSQHVAASRTRAWCANAIKVASTIRVCCRSVTGLMFACGLNFCLLPLFKNPVRSDPSDLVRSTNQRRNKLQLQVSMQKAATRLCM